jgi:hypothetical protein
MLQQLIDRSGDLKRLRDDGYSVEVRSGYLLVKDVPFVNSRKQVKRGTLASELTLAGDLTAAPSTHVVYFAGEYPCDKDGVALERIRHESQERRLADGIVVQHSFSSKPLDGPYQDYYHKMMAYVAILCNAARAIDPDATAQTFSVIPAVEPDSVFNYIDTAASRANISVVTKKLELERLAIVGLGGTGSYVLDLVAKTPAKEIHLFDGDLFLQHNAFRSPGAPSLDDLKTAPKKAAYFGGLYSRMRRGIIVHEQFIDFSNADQLRDMQFVFLCLEGGAIKKLIVERLEAFGIPFIDVGMGVNLVDDSLGGILRVTTSTPLQREHLRSRVQLADTVENGEYNRNIQIADLNALNAALAVIKWKKLLGFYRDLEKEHHTTYTIDGNTLTNEDQK